MSGRTDVGTYTVSLYKVGDEDGRECPDFVSQVILRSLDAVFLSSRYTEKIGFGYF